MTIMNIIELRLKTIYSGLSTKVLTVMVLVVIAILLSGLYKDVDQSAKIHVGIHFEKESKATDMMLDNFKQSEVLSIELFNKDDGIEAVKEGTIQAFYVFGADMEERLHKGDYNEVADYYLIEGNAVPYLITDLLGAELIGEISIFAGMRYLEEALESSDVQVENTKIDEKELYDYALTQLDVETDHLLVNKHYVMPVDGQETDQNITFKNVILYKQVIFGIIYAFFSFYIMFLVINRVRDKEQGLVLKWYTTPMHVSSILIGEYISIVIGSLPLVFIVTFLQSMYEEAFLLILVTNLMYVLAISALFLLVGSIIEKVSVYALFSSFLVIVMGIISGSFFVVSGEQSILFALGQWMPSYKVLDVTINSIIANKSLPGQAYMIDMLCITVVCLCVTYILDMKPFKRFLY